MTIEAILVIRDPVVGEITWVVPDPREKCNDEQDRERLRRFYAQPLYYLARDGGLYSLLEGGVPNEFFPPKPPEGVGSWQIEYIERHIVREVRRLDPGFMNS